MKQTMINTCAALCILATTATAEQDLQFSAGADVLTAYVSEGRTFNDSIVLQPWVDISGVEAFNMPVSLCIWANYDFSSYDSYVKENQFQEVDYDLTLSIPNKYDIDINPTLRIWTYPDYDANTDVLAGIGFGKAIRDTGFYVALYGDIGVKGGVQNDITIRPSVSYSVDISEAVTVGARARLYYQDYQNKIDGAEGFGAYDIGPNISWGNMSASVVYIGQIDDEVIPDGKSWFDVEVLASLGYSVSF